MAEPADLDLERLKHARALELEMIKATAAFEHAALKLPFLLNGGALGVLLALYSSKGAQGLEVGLAMWAWILWLAGLGAATLATFLGFGSQFSFRKDRGAQVRELEAKAKGDVEGAGVHRTKANCYGKRASMLRNVASWFVVASFILFFTGVVFAFNSLK